MELSPELWDALFEQLHLGVAVWRLEDLEDDASLSLRRANRAACRMLGRELAPLYGKRMADAFPGTKPTEWKAYANVVRSGAMLELPEISYGDAVLPETRFALHAYALPDSHVCLVFENLTQLRIDKEQASRQSSFLDSILDHIPAMVFVKDAEHLRFERMNKAGEELTGLSRHELLGKDDYAFFPPAQAAFFQSADRDTLKSGQILEIPEESIQTRDGQRWLYTRKIPILGPQGPEHLLGVSIDITTRKQAQRALERAEANFRTLVEHCPDAIFAQRAGKIAFANPAFVRLLGFAADDSVIGRQVEFNLAPGRSRSTQLAPLCAWRRGIPRDGTTLHPA
jgi:PAS domain S-box-containing protein